MEFGEGGGVRPFLSHELFEGEVREDIVGVGSLVGFGEVEGRVMAQPRRLSGRDLTQRRRVRRGEHVFGQQVTNVEKTRAELRIFPPRSHVREDVEPELVAGDDRRRTAQKLLEQSGLFVASQERSHVT